MSLRTVAACVAIWGLCAAPTLAQPPSNEAPPTLQKVRFEQRLGERVPHDAIFLDDTGAEVRLGDYLGERPVVLALVYYECPMLCPMIMNGLLQALKTLTFSPGEEFDVITVSFDPGETWQQARDAKTLHLERFGRPETAAGWHFLTGTEAVVRQLTDAVGFYYAYDPEQDEYAHAAGIVVLTPDGLVARYFYGIEFPPRDLRLGLVEAAEGKIGTLVDQVLLYCYRYDPTTGKYSAVVMNIIRLGGVVTVLVMAVFLTAAWRLDRRLAAMEKTV
ncbi:MAG: SCO family protein [Acidobacteriota bacterium]|nr:SCO family protein [Acidobacteriota bacterium]